MSPNRWLSWLIVCVLLATGTAARAETYSDPSGFSFTYPSGWTPVNRSLLADAQKEIAPELQAWLKRNQVNLDQVAVMVIRQGQDKFLENVNVVVQDGETPISDGTAKQMTTQVPKQYADMGAKVSNYFAAVQKIGEANTIVSQYRVRMPGSSDLLFQRQVAFVGGGKTFIVTFTGLERTFTFHEPAFSVMLDSFRTPASSAPGFDMSRVIVGATIGCVIGGVVGAVLWFVRRQPKKA